MENNLIKMNAKLVELLYNNENKLRKICPNCKKQHSRRSEFCCKNCWSINKYYKKKGGKIENKFFKYSRRTLKCLNCDKVIERKNIYTKFCNEKCRNKFRNKVLAFLKHSKEFDTLLKTSKIINPKCPKCNEFTIKDGFNHNLIQRYKCTKCNIYLNP